MKKKNITPCRLYQFEDINTGKLVLITNNTKEIEKYFDMTLEELNNDLKNNKMIKNKYTMSVIFID